MDAPRWPALLRIGFRPFFLLAAIAAIAIVGRTVLVLHGIGLTRGNPFDWHGHEMLFGYVAAVMAGFLLTAVPNWTRTPALGGAPLAAAACLWLLARVGLWGGTIPWWALAADLAFLPAIALLLSLPLYRHGHARHWLPLIVLLSMALANGLWHAAHWLGQPALMDRALAFATMLVALQIAVIGGRVTPAFTRNHLTQTSGAPLPRGADLRDGLAIGASVLVALAELVDPGAAGPLALVAAALHGLRLWGWRGLLVARDPLLLMLHVGYGWLAIGYALHGLNGLGPPWTDAWALHGLLVGAIGSYTLAMMSRATLGHSGQPLRAGLMLTLAFAAIQGAAVSRLLGPWVGADAWRVAAALWALAFVLYLVRCTRLLVAPPPVSGPVVGAVRPSPVTRRPGATADGPAGRSGYGDAPAADGPDAARR